MRPTLTLLDQDLILKIIHEAKEVLCNVGIIINNNNVINILSSAGAIIDKNHVLFTNKIIDNALKMVPSSFKLYDTLGQETHDFKGNNVYFTPGSTALNILDYDTNKIRRPKTQDYIDYAKVISQLQYIHSQSTAFIPSDA